MEKLTALEIEKIEKFREEEEQINQEKLKLADLILNYENLKLISENSTKELLGLIVNQQNRLQEFNKELNDKYGEGFTVDPEGNVVKPETKIEEVAE